jgi:hypothetical protein
MEAQSIGLATFAMLGKRVLNRIFSLKITMHEPSTDNL